MKAKIKIPDTVKDMTLNHLPFFLELVNMFGNVEEITEQTIIDMSPVEISDLNALFFGEQPGAFDKFTPKSNEQIFREILKSCVSYQKQDPKAYYEIDGVKYVLQLDTSEQPTSMFRDLSNIDFRETPLDLFGLCYIEEGMCYNQLDDNEKILNPRNRRVEKFKDISLEEYLNLNAFFLRIYSELKLSSKARARKQRIKNRGSGKKA